MLACFGDVCNSPPIGYWGEPILKISMVLERIMCQNNISNYLMNFLGLIKRLNIYEILLLTKKLIKS